MDIVRRFHRSNGDMCASASSLDLCRGRQQFFLLLSIVLLIISMISLELSL